MLDRAVPPAQESPEPHCQPVEENADGRRVLRRRQVLGDGRVRSPAVGAHLGPGRARPGGRIRRAQVRHRVRGKSITRAPYDNEARGQTAEKRRLAQRSAATYVHS